MRTRKRVDGLLLLDKPSGITSNFALQQVKRLYDAQKVGHTGTLDPLASGLLPLCFGEATKFSACLLEADKVYEATLKFGVTTETGDSEGRIVSVRPVRISVEQFGDVLQGFLGQIEQIPPMFSAIKIQGRPLYDYARQGKTVERPRRSVNIREIRLIEWEQDNTALIQVHCSKGTYIRSLAEDIGEKLGCGAHLCALRRIASSGFHIGASVNLERLACMDEVERRASLMPVDVLVAAWPKLDLDANETHLISQGRVIRRDGLASGAIRLYGAVGEFLGMGEILEGIVQPRRLIAQSVMT
ncbi:MAG: tRNA pseudouridine(55) synthase TruB [Proteobacteria bacterium]|nr:tRNA pseudouridine(55) synthase TruB [Pseudomonadota bacterium]